MAALTRRERKVKDILLKELREIGNVGGSGYLSYMEKQRLEKRLDHEFIDAELAKMRKSLRRVEWWKNVACALTVLAVLASLASLVWGMEFDFMMHAYWPLLIGMQVATATCSYRATQRRVFIYEALRELSDADEAGVQLDRAIHEADELIERVIRREMGEEALPAKESANQSRAGRTAGTKGVTLAEMQRQKEAGSTILDS